MSAPNRNGRSTLGCAAHPKFRTTSGTTKSRHWNSPLNKYQAPGEFQANTPAAAEATLPSARLRRLAPFVVRT
jgi:hypothetical protein